MNNQILDAGNRPVNVGDIVFTWSERPDIVAHEAKVLKVRDDQGFALIEYITQEQDLNGENYPFLSTIRTSTNQLYLTAEEAVTDANYWCKIIDRL